MDKYRKLILEEILPCPSGYGVDVNTGRAIVSKKTSKLDKSVIKLLYFYINFREFLYSMLALDYE